MSIVFFGTPRFAVPSLSALLESGETVAAVVTRPDRRRGRGTAATPSPVKEFSMDKGLRVLEPAGLREEAFLDGLKALEPEFLVVVAYGRILTRQVLDVPSIAPVNLHASILPRYRGASPIAWAIINGESETGITTMIMSEGLDEGDVLLQEKHSILPDDTAESLSERLSEAGGPLLARTLKGLREGTLRPTPQTGEPSYAPLLRKEDGRVDWSRPARQIRDFVRGMHPWPGAFCFVDSLRIRLLKVREEDGHSEPGRVVSASGGGLFVGTGEGLLAIEQLQPESGRPMSAGAFVQGRNIGPGTVLS